VCVCVCEVGSIECDTLSFYVRVCLYMYVILCKNYLQVQGNPLSYHDFSVQENMDLWLG
jgi:hypothetical protein